MTGASVSITATMARITAARLAVPAHAAAAHCRAAADIDSPVAKQGCSEQRVSRLSRQTAASGRLRGRTAWVAGLASITAIGRLSVWLDWQELQPAVQGRGARILSPACPLQRIGATRGHHGQRYRHRHLQRPHVDFPDRSCVESTRQNCPAPDMDSSDIPNVVGRSRAQQASSIAPHS